MARNTNSAGILALVGLGAYYLYKNRYRIQQFMESQGVKTPMDTSSIGSAISSGAAKLTGQLKGEVNGTKNVDRKAV